ncbi:MAG: type IV conjugative transfer system protein TraE [Rhodocyclaceae bacterium]|nr:type IV conjugative transfer system protein TraE [Rhodocyclaceae bacterium]
MRIEKVMEDVQARAGVTRAFQLILGASLLTNVFMAGAYATMDRTVRTVLVPPEIIKEFWVDGHRISPEYLEQMGAWVVDQFASVTPHTAEYKTNLLLKYVHPSVYGELQQRFKAGNFRLKQDNLSKVFQPREVRISESGQSVAFIGMAESWIADKRVPGSGGVKAYLVSFDYDGYKTTIKELRETDPQKPFDAMSQAALEQLAAQSPLPVAGAATDALSLAVPLPLQPQPQAQIVPPALTGSLPPPPAAPQSHEIDAALQAGTIPGALRR